MENVRSPLAGCLVQAWVGSESFGVSGGEGGGGVCAVCAYMCDVCAASVRRPDWRCEAEWTPCADEGGVQIVD